MATKIHKLVLIRGWTQDYYQLSAEEKQQLDNRVMANVEKSRSKNGEPLLQQPLVK